MTGRRRAPEFTAGRTIRDTSAEISVCCGLDLRRPAANGTLTDLDYRNPVTMTGGHKAWQEDGCAVAE